MLEKIKRFTQIPGAYFLFAFLLINIICGHHGGNNPNSRFAHLKAMSQSQTFNIKSMVIDTDNFGTDDWSSTGPHHYYSNKAPGSAFLAFPIFFILDTTAKWTWNEKKKGNFATALPSRSIRKLTSLFTQVLFFILLYLALYRRNQLADVFRDQQAGLIFLFLFLFCHIGANYMNTLFGHGVAIILTFWLINSILIKNPLQLGLSFGLALLNDYSFALFLPATALFLFLEFPKTLKTYKNFIIGGIPAGVLWIWYHWICFGSPLAIANKFQNPKYVDVQSADNIGGLFSTNLNLDIAYELFFGMKRGLLTTQPWVLIAIIFIASLLFNKKIEKKLKLFFGLNLMTFFFLFLMNMSFGGWHGGSTVGPRYLSIIFPWFAISLAIAYKEKLIKPVWKNILIASITYSFLFYNLVNATTTHSEEPNTIKHLLLYFKDIDLSKSIMRIISSLIIIGLAYNFERKPKQIV